MKLITTIALSILVAITLNPTYTAADIPHVPPPPPKPVVQVKQVTVAAKKAVPIKMSCELLRPLISQYDWDVEMVLKIANYESGCNPKNHNYKDVHRTCLGSWNVLNVGCGHYKKGEDINDMALNIKKGYKIYKDSKNSFRQWTTCKKIAGCS